MTRLLAALSIAFLSLFAAGCEAPGASDEPAGATDADIDEVDDSDEATGGAETGTDLDVEGGPAAADDAEDDADGVDAGEGDGTGGGAGTGG